jgi:hypothetical protein
LPKAQTRAEHTPPCAFGSKLAIGKFGSFVINLFSIPLAKVKQKYKITFSAIPTLAAAIKHTEKLILSKSPFPHL